jgi:hypothetical protein
MNIENINYINSLINNSSKFSLFLNLFIIILGIIIYIGMNINITIEQKNLQIGWNKKNKNRLLEFNDNDATYSNSNGYSNSNYPYSNNNYQYNSNQNNMNYLTNNMFLTTNDIKKKNSFESLSMQSFLGKWRAKDGNKFLDFINDSGSIRIEIQPMAGRGPLRFLSYNFVAIINDGEEKKNWMFVKNNFPFSIIGNNTVSLDITLDESLDDDNNNFHRHNFTTITKFKTYSSFTKFHLFDLRSFNYYHTNVTLRYDSDMNGKNMDLNSKLQGDIKSTVFEISFEVENEQKPNIYSKISTFSIVLSVLGIIQLFNIKYLLEKFSMTESSALKVI